MRAKTLNFNEFDRLLESINCPKGIDREYVYNVYDAVIEGVNAVIEASPNNKYVPVNHVVVVLYIINEYMFSVRNMQGEEIERFKEDDKLSSALASTCCDKYFTNEQLNYRSKSFLNKFNPQISTLNLYLNFSLQSIEKITPKNNVEDLFRRLFAKAFTLGKSILELLINGFETEAFSTWRTLHENESIVLCLMNYGDKMIDAYMKHITYALAYRKQMSVERQDAVFAQIKEEMKAHELKSKDMKKFIEYGYLYSIEDFDELGLKLNFRDGVEKAAKLSEYSKTYEMSSELAHSSALLLFTNNSYFSGLTLLSLYESFFRLERVFEWYYRKMNSPQEYNNYRMIKQVYMNQLIVIYRDTKDRFIANNKIKTQS